MPHHLLYFKSKSSFVYPDFGLIFQILYNTPILLFPNTISYTLSIIYHTIYYYYHTKSLIINHPPHTISNTQSIIHHILFKTLTHQILQNPQSQTYTKSKYTILLFIKSNLLDFKSPTIHKQTPSCVMQRSSRYHSEARLGKRKT